MGYYVTIEGYDFTINKDKFDDCYKAMCKLNERDDLKNGGGWNTLGTSSDDQRPEGLDYHPAKWFSWMDANYPEKCKTFLEILGELGFTDLWFHPLNGDLIGLSYDNKTGNEYEFFDVIAPFVEKDSRINWIGEDHSQYQWYFDGEKLITKYAEITYK